MGHHLKMNFEYFQIQRFFQTGRSEKLDGKYWMICPVSMFASSVMILRLCEKVNFVLTSGRNLSLLTQLTYMHLKGLSSIL